MTPQERELLTGLFDRLKQVERNPKDEEAEAFIAQAMAAQPSAPYFMAQVLLVQDQALSARVPDGDAEHAVEPVEDVGAPLLVAVDDHFGVAVGIELVTTAFELPAKFGEVIDLTVVSNPHTAVFIAHRHVAIRRKIDNRQPPAAETARQNAAAGRSVTAWPNAGPRAGSRLEGSRIFVACPPGPSLRAPQLGR